MQSIFLVGFFFSFLILHNPKLPPLRSFSDTGNQMLRIPGERVSGADEHQAGPGLGDPHLQEAGGRRGKQVRWASLHLSSGRDAHKHLWFRGTGAGGSSRHSPVTGGIPSTAKTGRQPVAQWFPVPAWHLTPAFPQGCHGSGRSLTSSSLSREGDVPLSSMGGYL